MKLVHEIVAHRIGNLALLRQSLNSAVSNGPWSGPKGKLIALQKHGFLASIADVLQGSEAAWNDEEIDKRTHQLIEVVKSIWPTTAGYRSSRDGVLGESTDYVYLIDLMNVGLLEPGQTIYSKMPVLNNPTATVTQDGRIQLNDVVYDTPSGAGRAVRGLSTNGWGFWSIDSAGRKTLRLLRELYKQNRDSEKFTQKDLEESLSELENGSMRTTLSIAELWLEFWTSFAQYMNDCDSAISPTAPPTQQWMNFSIGRSGIRLNTSITSFSYTIDRPGPELRVELIIDNNKEWFNKLHAQRSAIEAEFGASLEWINNEDTKNWRIVMREHQDPTKRDNWPSCHEWLHDNLLQIKKVMQP